VRFVRADFELLKAELARTLKRVAIAAGLIGAAGVFLLIAFIEALGALPAWLGPAVFGSTWLGWLVVGGLFMLVAVLLAFLGTKNVRRSFSQGKQTFNTIKEDGEWLRGLIRPGSSES